ncbi:MULTISPECIES: hypothetical protein [Acidithrix]|uniref:DUF1844 domain-containing protein n=1 Tax=Acidithrix ferrooxidans TaxID=1280514 RepID=A0A0D8HHN6_9ACTN|nr:MULTISPECIES: hypothetical protein [Acidithrix]KJF16591.1 hypothetical protein AXFE_25590 [Acidithrix ferrooxidans]
MSTLWTPDGEYTPKTEQNETPAPQQMGDLKNAEEKKDETQELADQIRKADPAVIVANHCYGLFELAAIHLSDQPPNLIGASLAIDALAGIVTSLEGRLGEYEPELTDALAQLRLAFIQMSSLQ